MPKPVSVKVIASNGMVGSSENKDGDQIVFQNKDMEHYRISRENKFDVKDADMNVFHVRWQDKDAKKGDAKIHLSRYPTRIKADDSPILKGMVYDQAYFIAANDERIGQFTGVPQGKYQRYLYVVLYDENRQALIYTAFGMGR